IRNQQVASSILAGGSILFVVNSLEIHHGVRRAADCGKRRGKRTMRPFPPGTTLPEKLLSDDAAILWSGSSTYRPSRLRCHKAPKLKKLVLNVLAFVLRRNTTVNRHSHMQSTLP
ncbi:MAG TPA: hypothetical protein VMU05_24740, partial [Dongiaceae bacterium]|nr:hypothetical protein [Dongiaceae bacterium]